MATNPVPLPVCLLLFEASAVRRLLLHAKGSVKHQPSLTDIIKAVGWREPTDAEIEQLRATTPPALHFVKDDGAYLKSNGYPPLFEQRKRDRTSGKKVEGELPLVVYAKGYEPPSSARSESEQAAQYEKIRTACGGDDFVEVVPIDEVMKLDHPDCKHFFVELTDKLMSFGWQ